MISAKRQKTAQQNAVFTRDGFQRTLQRKNLYADEMVFPFVASLIDRSIELEASFDQNGMNVKYSDTVNRVLAGCITVGSRRGRRGLAGAQTQVMRCGE